MFCPNCGTKISDNAKFCSNCGAKMEEQSVPAAQPDSAVQPDAVTSQPVVENVSEPEAIQNIEPGAEVLSNVETPLNVEASTEGTPASADEMPAQNITEPVTETAVPAGDENISAGETQPFSSEVKDAGTAPAPETKQQSPQFNQYQQPPYGQQPYGVPSGQPRQQQTPPQVPPQAPQYGQYQQPQQPQYGQPQYGQQRQPYGQPPQNQQYGQQPPQAPQYGQYQQPQYGQQQYQTPPQRPYGQQPFMGQPVQGQTFMGYQPAPNTTARLFAIFAACALTLGLVFLCIPFVKYIDPMFVYISARDDVLAFNIGILSAVFVPLITLIIEAIFAFKAISCRRKAGGLQLVSFILVTFLWVVARFFWDHNYKTLIGKNEFAYGIYDGASYYYADNWLLFSMICLAIALVLQIIKLVVFKKKKAAPASTPYGYQY
jgi:hypothetical protein